MANTISRHHTMRGGTFRRFTLTTNMRVLRSAGQSASHQDWLLRVGEGRLDEAAELHPLAVPLPEHVRVNTTETIVLRRLALPRNPGAHGRVLRWGRHSIRG